MEERGREERGGEGREKRGEEGGEGRDGSLHPLEFSKVGAYDLFYLFLLLEITLFNTV